MNARRWTWLAALVVVTCACAKAPPVPTDRFYRLPEPEPATGTRLTEGVISVRAFRADGLRSERALLFSEDPAGVALRQYHYHFWVDSPPRLLQSQLVGFLRGAGAASVVLADGRDGADLVIGGRINRFERSLGGGGTVHVALELRLQRPGEVPLLVRDYAATGNPAGAEPEDAVVAYQRAVTEIFARFVQDASGVLAGAGR